MAALAVFFQEGDSIDYTPSADVASGDVVVQGDLVAIAKLDIKANKLGSLWPTGVYDVPKATGGGSAIAIGLTVYWDAANKRATTTSSGNKLMGKVTKANLDADTTVRVRLFQ